VVVLEMLYFCEAQVRSRLYESSQALSYQAPTKILATLEVKDKDELVECENEEAQ
jgi:hypothetical protein